MLHASEGTGGGYPRDRFGGGRPCHGTKPKRMVRTSEGPAPRKTHTAAERHTVAQGAAAAAVASSATSLRSHRRCRVCWWRRRRFPALETSPPPGRREGREDPRLMRGVGRAGLTRSGLGPTREPRRRSLLSFGVRPTPVLAAAFPIPPAVAAAAAATATTPRPAALAIPAQLRRGPTTVLVSHLPDEVLIFGGR